VLDSLLAGPTNLNMFGGGGISNKTSRLYRALVDKEFAVSLSGGSNATIDPFLYNISLTLHPKRKPEEALAALDDEIKRVQDELVPEEEVARAIKQARANFAYGTENITNQAFWLGYAEMFAAYDWFITYLENMSSVTPQEVRRVAREYLTPRTRVVGTYIPRGNGEAK
jgi:zinc protease